MDKVMHPARAMFSAHGRGPFRTGQADIGLSHDR